MPALPSALTPRTLPQDPDEVAALLDQVEADPTGLARLVGQLARARALPPGRFAPQPGPQEEFCRSPADITIYGGAAGGGKSWAAIFEVLQHVGVRGFGALLLRKWLKDIKQTGGLWSEAENIYPLFNGRPNRADWRWKFPSGSDIAFGHVDADFKERFKSAQIALLIFDELTHFTEEEFFYLLTRLRSSCGVRPYVRATTNPDADSWVAEFLAWWIDQDTGYPIAERAGKVRWYLRRKERLYWASSRAELLARFPDAKPGHCKSVAFVPAKLEDNCFLGEDYEGNLLQQDEVQQERLLLGNWKIRYDAGALFKEEWWTGQHKSPRIIDEDELPDDIDWVRAWDLAATADKGTGFTQGGADFTAGLLLGRSRSTGRYYVRDLVLGRWDPADVEQVVKRTAVNDGQVKVWINQERAGAGKHQLSTFVRLLAGYTVDGGYESGEKPVRLSPVSAQAKQGHLLLVRGPWNRDFLLGVKYLPKGHDDVGDALAAAFYQLTEVEGLTIEDLARAAKEDEEEIEEIGQGFDFSNTRGMTSW